MNSQFLLYFLFFPSLLFAQHQPSKIIFKRWNADDAFWENYSQEEYEYDDYGNVSKLTRKKWDNSNLDFQNHFIETFKYNEFGNSIGVSFKKYGIHLYDTVYSL